ncbi:MAG: bifunctional oligoribonuclease/PAP phosphatase NrnA [Anaerolineae bacterium]
MNIEIAAFHSLLCDSRRILLLSHVSPDGDAIGSQLGLQWLLQASGYNVIAANQDDVPPSLRSDQIMPGWQSVVQAPMNAQHAADGYDLVIALDCSDLPRLGKAYDPALASAPLVNIDHHITNLHFAAVNLVDPTASSTAEMVWRLANALGLPIGPEAAQCLLTGIVTDTRSFRVGNVTPALLGVAQQLMEAGAALAPISELALDRRNLDTICLWGQALAALRLEERIIWTAIPLAMRRACNGVEQSDSGLANFLIGAEEADVALILTEREDGQVDVGMRAASDFDVAQVALALGGGGHPRAAGCSLTAPLEQAAAQVLDALKQALAQQRGALASAEIL